jgi:hypothetical protein
MSATEILAILALVAWSVYRQTRTSQVTAKSRFKMAIIYTIVGLSVGGFDRPGGLVGYGMIAIGLALSLVVGLARGRLTRVWADTEGRVFSQGTAVTVALFLGLVAVKFGLGVLAWFAHINDGAGFGEVLIMIAIMIAVQAQIVYRRAETLTRAASRRVIASQTKPARSRDHLGLSIPDTSTERRNNTMGIKAAQRERLQRAVSGAVLLPGEGGYADATRTWDLAAGSCPPVALVAASAADIAADARWAKENDLDIAVLNTGHGALDHNAGALVINASRVNPAAVDSSTRRAIVGAGTRWADVSAASAQLGLTGLAGASPGVGVIGYTLGGGLSPIGRTFGFASGRVVRMTVLDAECRPVRVDAQDGELFGRGIGSADVRTMGRRAGRAHEHLGRLDPPPRHRAATGYAPRTLCRASAHRARRSARVRPGVRRSPDPRADARQRREDRRLHDGHRTWSAA